MTTWPTALKFAGTHTSASSSARSQTETTAASSSPITAAMVPGRSAPAAYISCPRKRTVSTAAAKSSVPAAT